jgi:hypothetical protein
MDAPPGFTHPTTTWTFFRMVSKVYHGKKSQFPVAVDADECDMTA